MISFDSIPVDMLTHGTFVEIDNTRAVGGVLRDSQRICVIGQRLSTGTVNAGVATRITNSAEGEKFFGRGSMLAGMLAALSMVNTHQEVWAIALDDNAAGAQASGSIAVNTAATVNGTLHLYIAGQRVDVGVKTSDSQANVAANIVAAVNAQTDLPVSASVNGSDSKIVDLTARHKGLVGNDIDIRTNYYAGQSLPTGLTLTITAFSGGTSNPDIQAAIAAFGSEHYHHIVMPYTDASTLSALDTEMEARFGGVDSKQGTVYAAVQGTLSANISFGDALNSKHISVLSLSGVPEMPYVWAAQYAGQIAYHGSIDPARPYQTLPFKTKAPAQGTEYTRDEREQLLRAGLATYYVQSGMPRIERAVTTYKKNAGDIADPSYRDLNTLHTLAFIRYAIVARIASKFPRFKLADNGTRFAPGQAVVTPNLIRNELIALFRELEDLAIVEDFDQFKADLNVVRSSANVNRVDAVIPPNIVNQFRQFAGKVQYRL